MTIRKRLVLTTCALAAFFCCAFFSHRKIAAIPVQAGHEAHIAYGVSSAHPNPSWRCGPMRQGRCPFPARETYSRARWSRRLASRPIAPPLVSRDGSIWAISSSAVLGFSPSGEPIRSTDRDVQFGGAIAPDDSVVFMAGNHMLSLAPRQQSTPIPKPAMNVPILIGNEGFVSYASISNTLVRADASGRIVHEEPMQGNFLGIAARNESATQFVVATNMQLHFLDPATREHRTLTVGGVRAGPVVDDRGSAWVLLENGQLQAWNDEGIVSELAILQTASRPLQATQLPVVGRDGNLRASFDSQEIVCFDPGGAIVWRTDIGSLVVTAMTIDAHDNVMFGTNQNELVILAPDGRVILRRSVPNALVTAPIPLSDGALLLTARAANGWILEVWE